MKTTLIALLLVSASNAVKLGEYPEVLFGIVNPVDRGAGEHADHNRAKGTVYENGSSLHPA